MVGKKRSAVKSAKFSSSSIKQDTLYRAVVDMRPKESSRDLEHFGVDYCCMPQVKEGRQLHFYAKGSAIRAMQAAGRKVDVLADALAEGRKMQKLVAKGDRFKGGRKGPEGVGQLI
jgi:hypothetical protein